MGLLDAGGSGWCLRWSATASRVVYDGQHGRCSLVSARGPGDGGEVLKGSRFPGCCSRQLGLPPHGKPRDNRSYRAAKARAQKAGPGPLAGPGPARRADPGRRVAFPPTCREHPVLLRYHDYSRDRIASDQWTGIHANGINTYPLEWTRSWNGLDANPLESIA